MASADNEELGRVLQELGSRPTTERAELLMEIAETHAGTPVVGLDAFLSDPELVVRIAAAHARWQTARDESELAQLVATAAEGLATGDDELALTAGTALTRMDEAAVPHLIRWFDDRGGKDALAVRVIGEIEGEEALSFLRRMVDSGVEEVAEEAQEALEEIEEEEDWEE